MTLYENQKKEEKLYSPCWCESCITTEECKEKLQRMGANPNNFQKGIRKATPKIGGKF